MIEKISTQGWGGSLEIVVVDSGSHDGTPALAQSLGAQVIRIAPERFSYGFALNIGIERAKGDIICCLSAHCMPVDDNWLKELVLPIIEKRADATFGRQVAVPGRNPFEEISLSKHFPPDCPSKGRVPFSNANSAFRRTMWEIRRFDEHVPSWEDYLWYYLLKDEYKFFYCPKGAVFHTHPFSFKGTMRRAYNDGRAFRMIREKYGIDVVQDVHPSLKDKLRAIIADTKAHARLFGTGKGAHRVALVPMIRLATFVALWKGYNS